MTKDCALPEYQKIAMKHIRFIRLSYLEVFRIHRTMSFSDGTKRMWPSKYFMCMEENELSTSLVDK